MITKTIYANLDSAATSNFSNKQPGVELQYEPIISTCADEFVMLSTKTKELTIEE